MTRMAVDLVRLDGLIDRMAAVHAQLGRVRDDVEAQLRRLAPSWAGAAASAEQEAEAEWRAGFAEVAEALGDLHSIAVTAHANYSAAAAANRRMWTTP